MLVATVKNQLGNQMFAYAVVKLIALKKGYTFRYILQKPKKAEIAISKSNDQVYGNTIDTIFVLDQQEMIEASACHGLTIFNEWDHIVRSNHRFYLTEAFEVSDDTIMNGHFISGQYLEQDLDIVRKWFTFPLSIRRSIDQRIEGYRTRHTDRLIGVHFRCAKDYFRYGYRMDYSYWQNAARSIKESIPDAKFVVFYDVKGEYVQRFAQEFDAQLMHGSLVEDMYAMSRCDGLIISNSSFSLMAGLLNPVANIICCPSHYYSGADVEQYDCFPKSWRVIPCKRDLRSLWYARLKLYKIAHLRQKLSR